MIMYNPPHPGEVLREYLGNVSVSETAKHLGVTRAALSRVLNGSAGVSADMSVRLSDALGTSPDFWARMQTEYDVWQASRKQRKKVARLAVA